MEIGEYLTNVLSINDFALIPYKFLEPQTQTIQPNQLSRIEVSWRKTGALVVISNDRSGLWLFGVKSDAEFTLPSTATLDADGLVEVHGIKFVTRQEGTFESSSTWKAVRALPTPSASQAGSSPLPVSSDAIRSAQAANARAVQNNTSPPIAQESGTAMSLTKIESPATPVAERNFPPPQIQEHLIAAVLASLNYRLCYDRGFISLNARTLILPSPGSSMHNKDETTQADKETRHQKAVVMMTLDVHLTSLGNLIVKASPIASLDFSCILNSNQHISSASTEIEGADLYLAPLGSIARFLGASASDDSINTAPSLQHSEERYIIENPHLKSSLHKWKQRCIRWLEDKGILRNTFEAGGWIMVQMFLHPSFIGTLAANSPDGLYTPEEKLMTIAWPTLLCFRRQPSGSSPSGVLDLPWNFNPLHMAEQWFTQKADRELTIAKRKKEREAATAVVKAQAESEARLSATNQYSPVALRRASIAGAVYPTPPDGLPIGATPSFDGNVSTPGYPNTQPVQTEGEQLVSVNREVEDADGGLFDVPSTKRDHVNTSLDFTESGNDLFGDMGGDDLFGENDITDADFSFFDEPDNMEQKDQKGLHTDIAPATIELKVEAGAAIDALEQQHDQSGSTQVDIEMNDVLDTSNLGRDDIVSSPIQIDQKDPGTVDQTSAIPITTVTPKIPSPPLSPELIFNRLSKTESQAEDTKSILSLDRRLSIFKGVDIDNSMLRFNEKYGAHGRFTSPLSKKTPAKPSSALPKTGYLNKKRKTTSTSIDMVNNAVKFRPQMATFPPNLENIDIPSDAESPSSVSSSSDQDDSSNTTDHDHVDFLPSLKRKRSPEELDDDDHIASSFQELNVDQAQSNSSSDPLDSLDPTLLDPDPADWSLAKFFSYPESRNTATDLTDLEYITAAQILSEQAISRTLLVPEITTDDFGDNVSKHTTIDSAVNIVQEAVSQATKAFFDRAIQCTLANFLDIQGQHPIGQLNRLPPRPMPNPHPLQRPDALKLRATFPLPAPHLQVRRADSKLTVLPSAIPFWENLGLGPSKGGKDVTAFCIYPSSEGVAEGVADFLEHIRSAYESAKLGTHNKFPDDDGGTIFGAAVPLDFGEATTNISVADHQSIIAKMNEASSFIATLIAEKPLEYTNIVIYYVYDPNNAELLVPICAAFHELFRLYKEGLASSNQKSLTSPELVLQLVPLNLVASRSSLVVPHPFVYSRLAMEVYDRCVDVKSGTPSPSIVLETPLPRNIDFKLTPNPSASLLQENSVMHVAYTQSIDDRWITAAWTDNTGNHQATASYCLGRKNAPLTTSFSDIAHEIWETTLDIISMRKVHWRIMITKSGVMESSEIDFWKGLASTESKAQISLTVFTVDTTPSLALLPSSISIPPSSLTAPYASYTTPVSTPSASVISPDQYGNPQTPHSHNPGAANASTPTGDSSDIKLESDATLIDVTDQTWGVVLSHRLNNSRSLLEFHPTLFSGYLIKRSGSAASDPLVVMEVNLVHSEMNPRLYEALVREVLGYYRGLATLARARAVVAREGDGRPWHIAAVEKAVAVLHLLM